MWAFDLSGARTGKNHSCHEQHGIVFGVDGMGEVKFSVSSSVFWVASERCHLSAVDVGIETDNVSESSAVQCAAVQCSGDVW